MSRRSRRFGQAPECLRRALGFLAEQKSGSSPLSKENVTARHANRSPRDAQAAGPCLFFEYLSGLARLFHGLTPGAEKPQFEDTISHLTVVRLNEPENIDSLAKPWPPAGGLDPEQDPFFRPRDPDPDPLHLSSLEGDVERVRDKKPWTLDLEWGTALSLIAHLLLATLWLLIPRPESKANVKPENMPDPMGLVKLLQVPEKPPPIPVHFYPAPGQRQESALKRVLPSDESRRAHGGDPALPKAETPKSVAKQGIQDLAAGQRSQKMAENAGADGSQTAKAAPYPPPQREAPVASAESLSRRGLSGLPVSPLSGMTAEDAARAARMGDQGGDGGAGFNSDGGFVDNGPLSFDTKNYDWSSYAAEMVRKIKRNWEVPGLAHYGVKGWLVIKFYIRRDGTVEDVRILQSSGVPPFDNAAAMAIRHASPFKPLPADLNTDREGVTIGFFYNLRPEEVPNWNR
ncbi:MAG: hypothetical protein DIJKHBIC_02843 [Thermoanaerobaculia bacterium]|nr:hypothetical protein [Thermoanaerobaculia bacterium]